MKMGLLEEKVSQLNSKCRHHEHENATMHRLLDRQWSQCERTILKAEKLMEQKTPIVVTEVKPAQELVEPNVDEAVKELTGGAI